MSSVLVCDTQSEYARQVAKSLTALQETNVLYVPTLVDAVRHIREGQVDLLIVGPTMPIDDVLVSVRSVRDEGSQASIVLVPETVTQDLLHSALRAGVDDVVASSSSPAEIEAVFKDALDKANRRSGGHPETGGASAPGTVVTVMSTKGGVGKTVVATNLAVAMASLGKTVALVDLDLQFGDVGIVLGLEPVQTIVGAVMGGERLDAQMLRGFLTKHSSGVEVLLAPTQPEDAELVTASRIDRIIGLLMTMFEFVVIDTPPVLDEAVLTSLDRSDRVLAITMMDVASVKNSRVSLQKLRQLGYNTSSVDVMLNRADSKVYLRADEVEQAIGMPIKYRLPSDLQIPRSVNKGMPVVLEAPRSQPAKVFMDTAKALIAERQEVHPDVA